MSKKERAIQIPYTLFLLLVRFFLLDEQDEQTTNSIKNGLKAKIDSSLRHEMYTKYKTAPTPEQQEQARQAYLDAVGVPSDFRY